MPTPKAVMIARYVRLVESSALSSILTTTETKEGDIAKTSRGLYKEAQITYTVHLIYCGAQLIYRSRWVLD